MKNGFIHPFFEIGIKIILMIFSVSKTISNDTSLDAEFTTTRKEDYLAFKNSIKKLGFIQTRTTTSENGSLELKFRKGIVIVIFQLVGWKNIKHKTT